MVSREVYALTEYESAMAAMQMSKPQILLALALVFIIKHGGASENTPVPIPSFAETSCGVWTASKNSKPTRQIYVYWFRGFIAGYNFGSANFQVPLNAVPDNESLQLFVDKYCQENPINPFIGAAFELVRHQRKPLTIKQHQ